MGISQTQTFVSDRSCKNVTNNQKSEIGIVDNYLPLRIKNHVGILILLHVTYMFLCHWCICNYNIHLVLSIHFHTLAIQSKFQTTGGVKFRTPIHSKLAQQSKTTHLR